MQRDVRPARRGWQLRRTPPLTKPEPAVAGLFAVAIWLALRSRSGTSLRREVALVAAPALLIPAVVYGGLLTFVSADRLLFDNLYPVDVLEAGGNIEVRGRVPLTLSSFVELGGKFALYAAGAALMLLAAYCLQRGGLARRAALGCCRDRRSGGDWRGACEPRGPPSRARIHLRLDSGGSRSGTRHLCLADAEER